MLAHSKIGASTMERWSACPGSVALCQKAPPQKPSAYAQEGTLAHEYAALWLNNNGMAPKDIPKGMYEPIKVYVDAVIEDYKEEAGSELWVEQRFDLSLLHPGLFGTADAVIYKPKAKMLSVWDLKFGRGIPVEVQESGHGNMQLMYYALGALMSRPNLKIKTAKIGIVQPRCEHPSGPVRSFVIPGTDLIEFAADLVDAAKATEDPNAPLQAGEHCRFCPAAGTCPEIHKNAIELAKEEFKVDSYDPNTLSKVLKWLPTIEGWAESVRHFAYAQAQSGAKIPGWKLVAKRANRTWRNELSVIEVLREELDCTDKDIFSEPKLKSPAQIEKLLSKQEMNLIDFESYVQQVSSGLTLVPEEDNRPAVKCDAVAEFTAIAETEQNSNE